MSIFRLTVALICFAALAVGSTLAVASDVDRAITIWLHSAIPSVDVGRAAATLVFFGNAATIIPLVAAIGLALLVLGDERHASAMLALAVGMVGASLVVGFFGHVIVHPGPPNALRLLQFRRPADDLRVSAASIANAAVLVAVAVTVMLLLVVVRDRRRRPTSLWPAAAVIAIGATVVLLKHFAIGVPRALIAMMRDYAAYGYPSGHVTRMTLLAGTALRRTPAVGAILVTAMMVSLVDLGDHWTSEVFGGLCLGWACVEVSRGVWQRIAEIRWLRRP
ncbi:MAG TPA: hypothetical protein VKZ50_11440 [bacterium]|nr:hypothetical protein [bacterium]